MSKALARLIPRLRFTDERSPRAKKGGSGSHRSLGLGRSLDFREYRPYQPGDDLRDLDWRVYARSDRLTTRLYSPEIDETVVFLLDASASMESKWSKVTDILMGLATIAVRQGDRISARVLRRFEQEDQGTTAARGKAGLQRLQSLLDRLQPEGQCDLDSALEQVQKSLRSRSHVVVLSDFLQTGAGIGGLNRLRYGKHRLSMIGFLSREEAEPESLLTPGEWELADLENQNGESGPKIEIGPDEIALYKKELMTHLQLLKDFARKTGASFALHRSLQPLPAFFSEDLRQAGLLR